MTLIYYARDDSWQDGNKNAYLSYKHDKFLTHFSYVV